MRACVLSGCGGPEVPQLGEAPDPVPGAGKVLVSVQAAGVDNADLSQRGGRYPPPGHRPAVEILGLAFAGEIAAVGAGVTGHRPGDRVCGLVRGGGDAERAVTPAGMRMPVPTGRSWTRAAAIPDGVPDGLRRALPAGGPPANWRAGPTSPSSAPRARPREVPAAAEMPSPDRDCAREGHRGQRRPSGGHRPGSGGRQRSRTQSRGPGQPRPDADAGPEGRRPGRTRPGDRDGQAPPALGEWIAEPTPAREVAWTSAFTRRCLPLFPKRLRPAVGAVVPWTDAGRAHQLLAASAIVGKVVLEVS